MARTVVLLHGWGKNAPENLEQLTGELKKHQIKALVLKLPGFMSPEPSTPWGIEEYASWVYEQLKEKHIKLPILFGHSFGGQIATYIAIHDLYPLTGLVLCASASIRPQPKLHKRIIGFLASISPFSFNWLTRYLFPTSDYYSATPIMKQILARVTRQDLSTELSQITIPTLILWGELDQSTPPQLAEQTHNQIHNSKLVFFPDASHSLPYSHSSQITIEIVKFFPNK